MSAPASAAPPPIDEALRGVIERAVRRNVAGLQYIASPAPPIGATPKDRVLKRGTMNLFHYRARADEIYRIPVLMVMATTNRGDIFDLSPGGSLVEFLLDHGFDVYVIDWTPPAPDEKRLGLADYVLDFIPSCVAAMREETGERDFSLVGYCMGGVLATLYSALHADDPPTNLVCFTTPIDFSQMSLFAKWSDPRFFDVDGVVAQLGNVPSEIIFTSFEMLRPATRIASRLQMMENLWNDEAIATYRRFERWSLDTLPLPGEYFKQTVKEFFWKNAIMKGTLEIGGRRVDLGRIVAPFLGVVATHDHIVPPACAAPLAEMIGSTDKTSIELKGGHVSLVAGPNAVKRLWPTLEGWLAERSA